MLSIETLWIAFGRGFSARWIPVHEVVSAIGPDKASGMLYFHAFTGCDVVFSLSGEWLTKLGSYRINQQCQIRKTTQDRSVGRQLLQAVRGQLNTFLLYLQTAAPVFVPSR